jgi:hypothetical protein
LRRLPRHSAVVSQQHLDALQRETGRGMDFGRHAALAGQGMQVTEQPEAGDVGQACAPAARHHHTARAPNHAAANPT